LVKQIEAAGWTFYRTGKGTHMIYRHPTRPSSIVVAHGGKMSRVVPIGTANAILRQAGLR
jgi:predicted RNA binding protein YcfA (HicA-like mRNA interferase family)